MTFFTMQFVNVNAQSIPNNKKSTKKKVNTQHKKIYWFSDKEFTTDRPVSTNPEEGGRDVLIINKNKTGSINQGDIIYSLNWEVKGNYIYFTSEQLSRKLKFLIQKNNLVDEYGIKWFDKNKVKQPTITVGNALSLTNTQWIIEQFYTPEVAVKIKNCIITIDADQKTFIGSDGCNTLNGKVLIEKIGIKFNNVVSTKMACEFMEQGHIFVTNLNNCNNYKIVGAELFLYKDETLLMTLESYR